MIAILVLVAFRVAKRSINHNRTKREIACSEGMPRQKRSVNVPATKR